MPNHYTTLLIGVAGYDDNVERLFDIDRFNTRPEKEPSINLCNQVRPMPKYVRDTTVGSDGKSSGDPTGWLGWARTHWGTKWGTYEEKAYQMRGDSSPIVIEFQSAWGPPNADCMADILGWFNERGLGIKAVIGIDPYDNSVKFESAA